MPEDAVAASDPLAANFQGGLQQLGIELPDHVIAQSIAYVQLLTKWNRVYNLTAVRDPQAMISRHLLDCLVLLKWLPQPGSTDPASADSEKPIQPVGCHGGSGELDGNTSGGPALSNSTVDVLDVGSGAGLPVIPLALARPDLSFMSVESNGKKTRFQRQAVVELGVDNIDVRHARIEDVSAIANTVTSRAFTSPDEFLDLMVGHTQPGARALVMLGDKQRLPTTGDSAFELAEIAQLHIPGVAAQRHVAVCVRQPV